MLRTNTAKAERQIPLPFPPDLSRTLRAPTLAERFAGLSEPEKKLAIKVEMERERIEAVLLEVTNGLKTITDEQRAKANSLLANINTMAPLAIADALEEMNIRTTEHRLSKPASIALWNVHRLWKALHQKT